MLDTNWAVSKLFVSSKSVMSVSRSSICLACAAVMRERLFDFCLLDDFLLFFLPFFFFIPADDDSSSSSSLNGTNVSDAAVDAAVVVDVIVLATSSESLSSSSLAHSANSGEMAAFLPRLDLELASFCFCLLDNIFLTDPSSPRDTLLVRRPRLGLAESALLDDDDDDDDDDVDMWPWLILIRLAENA